MSDSERITNPTRISRLLERLAKRHALLTVQISDHTERYTSSVLGVEGSCVLLDELLPPSGHQVLVTERRLRITGKLDGIDIGFTTTLERVDNRDGAVTYHAVLPGQLEYRQRRQDYRVRIPASQRLRAIIERTDGTAVEGLVHDISHGGAGMIFRQGIGELTTGTACASAIELPDAVWLYCDVEICHRVQLSSRDRQLVGARFIGLSPMQTRLVGHCIIAIERQLIRNRADY